MKVPFLLLISLVIVPPAALSAQDAGSVEGIEEICETFLQSIISGDYNNAFAYLQSKPTSIQEKEFSEIELSRIQQDKTIRQIYGKPLGIQRVSRQNVSDTALKLVYLVLREEIPIRWKFIYYKPEKEWKLIAIEFDDLLEEIF